MISPTAWMVAERLDRNGTAGKARVGMAGRGEDRQGKEPQAWRGLARRGMAGPGTAGAARLGEAWLGVARHRRLGETWQGMARNGADRLGTAGITLSQQTKGAIMLRLTLHPGQHICIGDDIRVYGPDNGKVRLGFEAPPDVQIVRSDAKDKDPREHKPKETK